MHGHAAALPVLDAVLAQEIDGNLILADSFHFLCAR